MDGEQPAGILYYLSAKSIAKQRLLNVCRGRIADMTVPEALQVDTDGGIKPDMAFLALFADSSRGNSSLSSFFEPVPFSPFDTTANGA